MGMLGAPYVYCNAVTPRQVGALRDQFSLFKNREIVFHYVNFSTFMVLILFVYGTTNPTPTTKKINLLYISFKSS